jgi:alkaline phosphatase D
VTLLWDDQTRLTDRLGELRVGRRTTIVAGLSGASVPALGLLGRSPAFVERRRDLTSGVRSGEVTTSSAVIWSRAVTPSRLMVRLLSNGRQRRLVRGPWTDERADLTARVHLTGLAPGRPYDAEVWFESPDGERSAPQHLAFTTAPVHAAAQSVVWSADTCGQGWGIDRARGGLTTYRTMLGLRPDLFVHVGDTIYADEPMAETVLLPDGTTWTNELTEDVMVVSETLEQLRGRHRYPLRDDNVRAFHASVPTVSMWDDHETCNNWWPGETIDDERYGERRADVLALRGRRAWQEYQPVPVRRLVPAGGDGFVGRRLYRRVPRGQHLDLFCLDMRSWRGPNPDTNPAVAADRPQAGLLGPDQEEWMVRSLRSSTATWKAICADMPLSAPTNRVTDLDGYANKDGDRPVGREPELARILSAIKRHGVRNVVWLTGDVHYTAAYRYTPEKATFTDFDPFWEFISGPVASSPFWLKDDELDQTFGPEVVFSRGESEVGRLDVAPQPTNQYFGQLDLAASGLLTVRLYDGAGSVLWERTLEPEQVAR